MRPPGRLPSLDGAPYRWPSVDGGAAHLLGESPRTPLHAAVAYAETREAPRRRRRTIAVFAAAAALAILMLLLLSTTPQQRAPGDGGGSGGGEVLASEVRLADSSSSSSGGDDGGQHGGGGGGKGHAKAARYVVVLDCGSSGSRIYVYKWRSPLRDGSLPLVRAIPPSAAAARVPRRSAAAGGRGGSRSMYDRVETQPGLHDLDPAGRPGGGVEAALGPLLDWARAVVPRGERARTPLLLLATGGVRRLPAERQDELLKAARSLLARAGFLFEPSWARAISGAEEAAYGWVALNYARGTLPGGGAGGAVTAGSAEAPSTIGVLDLGGASMEVAFELAPAGADDRPYDAKWMRRAVNVTLAGRTHSLHTHAYAALGLTDAFDRGVTLLLSSGASSSSASGDQHQQQQQQQEQQQVKPPSQPPQHLAAAATAAATAAAAAAADRHSLNQQGAENASSSSSSSSKALTPRRLQQEGKELREGGGASANATATEGGAAGPPVVRHPCLHSGFRAPYARAAPSGAVVVELVGAPDFRACTALATGLVAEARTACAADAAERAGDACVLGSPQPRALAAGTRFAAVSGFFVVAAFLRLPPGAELGSLLAATERHCRKPWAEVAASGASNAERYCAWGGYVAALLQDGLGVRLDDPSSRRRVTIAGGDIAWPLGAALVEASSLPGFVPLQGGAWTERLAQAFGVGGGGGSTLQVMFVAAMLVALLVALARVVFPNTAAAIHHQLPISAPRRPKPGPFHPFHQTQQHPRLAL